MPTCRGCGDDHGNAATCPRTHAPVSVGPCGTRVDRWDVERLLGSGGFGAVYVARHSVLGTRVAMKLLRDGRASHDAAQRFVREARAAASIGSPHIVRVTDFGTTPEGDAFLVMELLEGQDLESVLKQTPTLPPARAVEVMRQLLDGLAAAHRAGIVHRDLKPANVFLAREGSRELVKLVDFGISKSVDPAEATITRTGVVVGTPAYMAPEQLRGAPVDPRADIYAASAVLYQLLSGHVPHEAPSFELLVVRVCTEDPTPLRTAMPEIDPQLAAVVERGLAREPASRWPSAEAFADALARLPASTLEAVRTSPFAATAFASVTPTPGVTPTPLGASSTPGPLATAPSPTPRGFASSPPGAVPPTAQLSTPPGAHVQSWASTPLPAPQSVRPMGPSPFAAQTPSSVTYAPALQTAVPQRSGGAARIAALGCAALLFGGITMGAIAYVTSKLLAGARPVVQDVPPGAPVTSQPTVATLDPARPAGGKPAATPEDDAPAQLVIGPGGSLHIGGSGMPDVDVPEPPPPPPPAMPPRGAHVVVDEPDIVSQNIDSAAVHRVIVAAQRDFDGCRGATATRVHAQVFFAFGHVTMAQDASDDTGDHSVGNCLAHRFREHVGNDFHEGDGIVQLWASVPAR